MVVTVLIPEGKELVVGVVYLILDGIFYLISNISYYENLLNITYLLLFSVLKVFLLCI